MSNTATVSFKMAPDRYAIRRAMADAADVTVSQFVRETVEQTLDLDRQVERLAALFAELGQERDSQN